MPGQAELGMTLEQQLRQITDALPETAAVVLPVTLIRGWLTDDTSSPAGHRAYLTVAEVAALFNRSPQTVRSWIRNQELDAYMLHGREYRITPRALEAFQRQQQAGTVSPRPEPASGPRAVSLGAWRATRRTKP
jgi:excisionase family DNA binding protein